MERLELLNREVSRFIAISGAASGNLGNLPGGLNLLHGYGRKSAHATESARLAVIRFHSAKACPTTWSML